MWWLGGSAGRWARSVCWGMAVTTPRKTAAGGRCGPGSSPQALASCSSDRRLASSLSSGAPSALLRIAIGDTPLSSLIPHPATFGFLHTTRGSFGLPGRSQLVACDGDQADTDHSALGAALFRVPARHEHSPRAKRSTDWRGSPLHGWRSRV